MYRNLSKAITLFHIFHKFLILFYNSYLKTPVFDSNNAGTVDFQCSIDNDAPQPLNQSAHSDLIRDLRLSKGSAEILSSLLKEKKLLRYLLVYI